MDFFFQPILQISVPVLSLQENILLLSVCPFQLISFRTFILMCNYPMTKIPWQIPHHLFLLIVLLESPAGPDTKRMLSIYLINEHKLLSHTQTHTHITQAWNKGLVRNMDPDMKIRTMEIALGCISWRFSSGYLLIIDLLI